MKSVFADTSYYLALVNPRDTLHTKAVRAGRRIRGRVVTTQYVLTELGNALSRAEHRSFFLTLLRQLRDDPLTVIIPATEEWFDKGLELFTQRPDKDWSLTDCISFVVMGQKKIAEALTEDNHFNQAGFRTLLRGR